MWLSLYFRASLVLEWVTMHTRRMEVDIQDAREFEIRAGHYCAVITARAGALRALTFKGRDLVVPFPKGSAIPDCSGIMAVPWPNRIASGRYEFDGVEYELPVNEPDRDCALHGLAFSQDWFPISISEASVTVGLELEPVSGYPFPLTLRATFTLESTGGNSGLTWEVEAVNKGKRPAPYGACPHPYLVAGSSPLDEWELELPAESVLEVSQYRLLPLRVDMLRGHALDFSLPRRIGSSKINHAFTNLQLDQSGTARLLLRDLRHATGVGMTWDRSCPWVQVYSADEMTGPTRRGLAVEPMTCPPDAFNSGIDIVRLLPDSKHVTRWRIFSVDK